MTPSRPYLIRAIREWIIDNGMTPHMLVDATIDDVEVPQSYVQSGKIVLNVSDQAVRGLDLDDNKAVRFEARFAGRPVAIHVPVMAVIALYALETGRGMVFNDEPGDDDPPTSPDPSPKKGKPELKVIK